MEDRYHVIEFYHQPGTRPLLNSGTTGHEERLNVGPISRRLGRPSNYRFQSPAVFTAHLGNDITE